MGEGVDAELGRILRERPVDVGIAALARDVERHFPHLAERMAGLARGAGAPRMALVVALARASCEPAFLFRPARALATRSPRALLAGRFDLSADRCSVPVVRRSNPQAGFASLELTLPWLASCLGGVNAMGLAVLLAPPGLALQPGAELRAEAACRAPALLFVQQCLERFGCVDTAVDWCLTRPSEGSATILLADASGRLAGVELDEESRRLVDPASLDSGALAGEPGSLLPALLAGARAGAGVDAAADALAHRACLWLDPAARALAVVLDPEGLAPARLEHFTLEPE
jgi:hypothetical protein